MRSACLALLPLLLVAGDAPLTKLQEAAAFHPKVATPGPAARQQAFEQRMAMEATTPFAAIPLRNVGPMGQGGRVVALAVDDRAPQHWLAAFATGGLWWTDTEGATWTPLFDQGPAIALGDVAVVWGAPGVPKVIWLGTGEANASRSSYAGAGVFRSLDGGKTWQAAGLVDSHRIARIVPHPTNPEVAYVAAQGPLYTEGGERGIFKTTDGGKTWTQVLKAPARTGATDLLMDVAHPDTLYATLWEKDRKPWDFLESGPGSGLFKSTDGGKTWTRLEGGLPQGEGLGRMGLAQSRQDPKKLYAFVDNQTPRPEDEKDPFEDPDKLTAKRLRTMDEAALAKVEPKRLKDFLKANGYPKTLTAEGLLADLKAGKVKVKDLLDWLGDADQALFDTNIIGPELYATEDGGATWKRTHTGRLDQFTYTYGYYFGQVRVDPTNDRKVYLLGMPAIQSEDGGRTFKGINGDDWKVMHPDHHALWIDPRDGRRLVLGNDGGLNVSTDGGGSWRNVKNLPVGQFYAITTDRAEPYKIYGGLQDNGVMAGPATPLKPQQQTDAWRAIYGGDGGFVQVNPRDNTTIYTESQFGHMSRLEKSGRTVIRPVHKLKETPHRFNWMTPLLMSPHSPDILYTGSQEVLRSLDRGVTWTAISGDLTTHPKVGNVPYGTFTTLAESPKRFGLLYAGTDDGLVQVSRDGGFTWKHAEKGLPKGRWVTRVEASAHDEGTAYATFSAYRNDASEALIFRTTDYGATWVSIKGNLPAENLNVIREDPANAKLLFAGSDFGVFVSLDGGQRWNVLGRDLPHVPVHDLAIQPKAKDLVVGTHGRSAFVAPIGALELLTPEVRTQAAHLFEPAKVKAEAWWKQDRPGWFATREPERYSFWFYRAQAGAATLTLRDGKDAVQRVWTLKPEAGLGRVDWDLQVDPATRPGLPAGRRPFVLPGDYTLTLEAAGQQLKAKVVVEAPKEPKDPKEEGEE
jgi:photosystem II stability/assembly factor-like uncharacterized protein